MASAAGSPASRPKPLTLAVWNWRSRSRRDASGPSRSSASSSDRQTRSRSAQAETSGGSSSSANTSSRGRRTARSATASSAERQRWTSSFPVETSRKAPAPLRSTGRARPRQGAEEVVLLALEQLGLAQGARRDDAGDLATHQPLGLPGVLHLIADRDLEAGTHQLAEVALERLVRHAAHRRFVLGAALARGERDLEDGRRLRRVLVEHLEEVAHAIEQDRVGVLRLHLEVVAQHRRELRRGA